LPGEQIGPLSKAGWQAIRFETDEQLLRGLNERG
jgi:hypothetical protein